MPLAASLPTFWGWVKNGVVLATAQPNMAPISRLHESGNVAAAAAAANSSAPNLRKLQDSVTLLIHSATRWSRIEEFDLRAQKHRRDDDEENKYDPPHPFVGFVKHCGDTLH
ncbi:unnamed protein product [Prunus brigantina]